MTPAGSEPHGMGGIRCQTPDRVMQRLATRQDGYVATRQLIERGISRRQIEGRVARGILAPTPLRGVWSFGPPRTTPSALRWRAFLACGPRSTLGLRSAGVVWQVLRSEGPRVCVLVPHGARPRAGLHVEATRTLLPQDVVSFDGLRVTSLPRTIADLARVLDHGQLVAALNLAEARHLMDVRGLHAVLDRTRAPAPRKAVLAALAETAREGLTLTDSELEEVLRALCREHGLPLPAAQVHLAGHRADAFWAAFGLVVEADGYAWHADRARFRADRALDRRRSALGLTTLRFTHAELVHEGAACAAEIRAALVRRGWRPAA